MTSKNNHTINQMIKRFIIILSALGFTCASFSQTLTQAKKWFTEGNFAEAKPVFQKLVKQAPSNASYNFWYGACCYETGEKEESRPYLEKSAARKVINAYLYLGKLYYDLYLFDEAVENIENHIYWLKQKKRDTESAELELERCRRGARMIRGTEKINVIDSFVVDRSSFLASYKLSEESGTITPGENGTGFSFTNQMKDKMLVSLPGDDGKKHLYSSIYMIDKWSRPEAVKGLDGSGENADYPFMASDGITLYYAAEGGENLGGYDIFVTRYNSDDNAYFRPDNVGMPFNSPWNDYMYAIDELNNLGWFVSDRYQPEGKVCIYVFIPNETKEIYDYETTDRTLITDAATLKSIAKTQYDPERTQAARRALDEVMSKPKKQEKKNDFHFIVKDGTVYTTLNDFRSENARKQFQTLLQKQKDLQALSMSLEKLRDTYSRGNQNEKNKLSAEILDKEKRENELRNELEQLEITIRNTEIKKIK